MIMTAQCAYTEGLTCAKGIQRGSKCFKSVCLDKTLDFSKGECKDAYEEVEADCKSEADDVSRVIPMDFIEACKPGQSCGICVEYEPAKKEGKQVVPGAKKHTRDTEKKCFDKQGDVIACTLNGGRANPEVVEEAILPKTTETCYAADRKTTIPCGIGEGGYADDVYRVIVDDQNPFFLLQKDRSMDKFTVNGREVSRFQEKQIDRPDIKSGTCDFLELEQLKTAYDCCSKVKNTGPLGPLVDYYNKEA